MNREDAIEVARSYAAAKPESYYGQPFQPHEWVIDAILAAHTQGYDLGIAEKVDDDPEPEVVQDVLNEVRAAMSKFPTWPSDPIHAAQVVSEEVGEFSKAVLQQVYEPEKNKGGLINTYKEAKQGAAMLLRWMASFDRYNWSHSHQHMQTDLKREDLPF